MAQVRQDNVQIKLEIDGSQSRTELDNLTRKAQLLKQGLGEMKRGTDEYVAANKELNQVNKRIGELRQELGLAGLTITQLGKLNAQLNRELKDLVPNTEAFVAKSREIAEVENRLAEVKNGARAFRDELGNAGNGFLDFVKKAAGFAGIQLGVQALATGLKQLGSESIDAAVKSSDSISDMEKSLNITTAEAKALREQLQKIDTRTAEENLEGIAIAAGQLGIAKDQAVAFTTAVDQAVVALGDEFTGGVEEVTKSLGGLQKLFKDAADVSPAEAITKIGSAINALGADGTATGPVIADFAARIGQLGDLAPQITQTLGLGAAFQELGLSAEISAGGLTNVLLTASKDTAGFAKQIGVTEQQFKQLINSNPNEVILRLAESFKGAANTDIIATLDGLGVKSQEATKVVSLLANQTDFVREKQALASKEYEKGTSLLDEYLKKNTNAAAEVAKAEKAFAQGRVELGERLIPVYILALQTIGFFIGLIKSLPGFLNENRAALGGLAVAVLTLNAEQIKLTATTLYNTAVTKGKILWDEAATFATTKYTTAQRLLNTAFKDNPVGLFIAIVSVLIGAFLTLYERSEKVRVVMAGLAAAFVQVAKNIKDAVITNLMGTADLIAGIFTFDPARIKKGLEELGSAVKKATVGIGDGVAGAFAQGYDERQKLEDSKREKKSEEQHQQQVKQAKKRAEEKAAAAATADLEALKAREANIKAALALVQAGSAEELRLKKQEVAIKRDIDLLGEKKTAGDKKVIIAEAQRDIHQLDQEFAKKQLDAAQKRAKEQAEVEKKIADLRAAQIPDEAERKIAQLIAAADREKEIAKGTAEQIAEQRRLIMDKLAVDIEAVQVADAQKRGLAELEVQKMNNSLIKNEFDRKDAEIRTAHNEALLKLNQADVNYVAKVKAINDKQAQELAANEKARVADHQQTLDSIAAIEQETAQISRAKRIKDANGNLEELKKIASEELAEKLSNLDKGEAAAIQKLDDEHAAGLISDQDYADASAAIHENYLAKKSELSEKYADDEKARKYKDIADNLGYMSQALTLAADLQKIASDKELTRLDKEKTQRLAKLDAEYKAGRISKESYEADKSSIETSYDEKTRAIKRQQAEKDKEYQIANSIIQGAIAVLAAAAANAYTGGIFSPVTIATGIAAAAATAKIIATPIPEFEKGGVWGRANRAMKQSWRGVKEYATGGRINPTAGVASVGQRHSGGGIRMVDGATGEHLGEWERGEPYMILSRQTYANNKHLVDELIDTSLYRGGAPVRSQQGYYEDGGVQGGPLPATGRAGGADPLVQAISRVEAAVQEARDAVRELPNRQYIGWDNGDTAEVEQRLGDREADRQRGQIN